jgi:hypothetical protein
MPASHRPGLAHDGLIPNDRAALLDAREMPTAPGSSTGRRQGDCAMRGGAPQGGPSSASGGSTRRGCTCAIQLGLRDTAFAEPRPVTSNRGCSIRRNPRASTRCRGSNACGDPRPRGGTRALEQAERKKEPLERPGTPPTGAPPRIGRCPSSGQHVSIAPDHRATKRRCWNNEATPEPDSVRSRRLASCSAEAGRRHERRA